VGNQGALCGDQEAREQLASRRLRRADQLTGRKRKGGKVLFVGWPLGTARMLSMRYATGMG
jgi:hypothetical protein